jgi:autophagy-related protein 9
MTSNIFERLTPSARSGRSFYEQLRTRADSDDPEDRVGMNLDEENFRQPLRDFDAEDAALGDSRVTAGSPILGLGDHTSQAAGQIRGQGVSVSRWKSNEYEVDNDVPESLLVEHNDTDPILALSKAAGTRQAQDQSPAIPGLTSAQNRTQWEAAAAQQKLHREGSSGRTHPRSLIAGKFSGGAREKALWRWVNTSNLDRFMRDVYDYFEGGGLWCILCSNALWLL